VNIVIRADASQYIGYGHIMRCLSLAGELKKRNVEVNFICREDKGNLIEFIKGNNFGVLRLPSEISIEKDAELTSALLFGKTGSPDYLIVDHYGLDISWEEYLKPHAKRMMVIDDFVNRKHICDILLNQNYGIKAQEYDDLVPHECKKLTGTSYVLLRDQFKAIRKEIPQHSGEVKKIFIFFGGADATNETKKAIEAMRILDKPDVSFIVLVGNSNPHREQIRDFCTSLRHVEYYQQVNDIVSLMIEADLAIGAGGSNTWERCCLGLPSIVTILAENQKLIVETLDKDGIVLNAGWFENVTASSMASTVNKLVDDKNTLRSMSAKAMKIVDGEGTIRVVEEMSNE
jgi:UDP-2,4-diacetamido-2,4,6-trideoxy-beta-L-altropyranose hydrolase